MSFFIQLPKESPTPHRVFFLVVKPLIFKVKTYTANMIYKYQKKLQ